MASTSYLKNAPLKDKIPGSWDVEVCHEGEADLYRHYKSCQKHPDHKEFIPVETFDITHLPTDCQDRDIVEYIKLVAQLTVRLTVRYVSPRRPATVPGTDRPYPFYDNRGEKFMRVGTGLITNVTDDFLSIKTATHVVFDKEEAKHTSCHIFYDNGDTPLACNTAIEKEFYYIYGTGNTITDENLLLVYKYSKTYLLQKIKPTILKLFELRKIITNRLLQSSYDRHNKPLTFIVSHPHGCSKKISIGRCEEIDDNLDDVRFLYTTPTCPGSSGAAVICLDKRSWNLNCTHSGTWKNGTSLNLGSCRYAIALAPAVGGSVWSPWRWEYPDLRLTDSQRFSSSHLPPEFSYNLMIDYIMTWSRLCVDVDVKYVSKQRPEFWPGSELPYPRYKKRGSREGRRGRGVVDRVDIYPNQSSPDKTCDCDTRRNSSTTETAFAHIYILTSTSLVFDQTEATKTTCRFNLGEFDRLKHACSNVETDRSQLMFVTHDLVFARALTILLEHVSFLKDKIQDKLLPELLANYFSIIIGSNGDYRVDRCVRAGKHLVYTNKAGKDDVGAPVIVLGNKHLHVEISGHAGKYAHDPTL